MTEFLAENNACGQNLLNIVSVGNSIIAEILRLKDYIPKNFRLKSKADKQKYGDTILDFSYFKSAELYEKKIEESSELRTLDDELRVNNLQLVTRFFLAFQSIHHYATELQQYVEELNSGYYIQQTLETVMQDKEGMQLLCEALYLFGVILLMLDFHIPGDVRERLIVAYYRYNDNVDTHCDVHDVCLLLCSTGYVKEEEVIKVQGTAGKQSSLGLAVPKYPEAYFARFSFDPDFVHLVIAKLRCDDMYNQLSIYPHAAHRTTALSTQAAMLYICLYFSPHVLHSDEAQMYEIVKKFYCDNWILSVYMGVTINLIDAWTDFKAARSAIAKIVTPTSVKTICQQKRSQLTNTLQKTEEIVRKGGLNEAFILENIDKIILLMRQANVLLRWYCLHSSRVVLVIAGQASSQNVVHQLVCNDLQFDLNSLYQLLLYCSQMELTVKEQLANLKKHRKKFWFNSRDEAIQRLNELSAAFAGTRALTKIEANSHLQLWFVEVAERLKNMDISKPDTAGRLIQMMQALDEVQEYHNLHANMLVKQYLQETREYLNRMAQLINIKEDIDIHIQIIIDFSYAWLILQRDFMPFMQENIKQQPKSVVGIRAVFLKLATALEVPLLRINQAKTEDLVSVSNYYSTELANFLRRVLQIVPETMFNILASIIHLLTDVIKEFPTRIEKDKLREYSQFEERAKVAELTNSIAVFTKGILMMKKTLVGVIELDPKQLLEDGIRKELVNHLANAYNLGLIFTPAKSNISAEFQNKLQALAKIMDGYRRSFEYIEDYLRVQGLRILLEETQRIIHYNVEKECNAFKLNKVQEWQSQYQSQTIPIPNFAPLQGDVSKSITFIGRLAHELLRCTEPRNTIYLGLMSAWYCKRPPHNEILSSNSVFPLLREAVTPAGMVGLERIYSHMLVDELKSNLDKLLKNLTSNSKWREALENLASTLESHHFPAKVGKHPLKYYSSFTQLWQKVWPPLLEWILSLGHKQILRQHIASELCFSSTCGAKLLENTADTLNRALLLELSKNTKLCDEQGLGMLANLQDAFLYTGNYEPFKQVFMTTKNTHNLSLWLLLFTIAHTGRLQYSANTDCLLPKVTKDNIDCEPLASGLVTLLQQFHKNLTMLYVSYVSQYVVVVAEAQLLDSETIGPEVVTMIHFLNVFVRKSRLPLSVLEQRIPSSILCEFASLATTVK